jgi:hypothetical protein
MTKSQIDNIVWDGVDHGDFPDMSDAFIVSADFEGIPMSEVQLDELNDNRDLVYELLMEELF